MISLANTLSFLDNSKYDWKSIIVGITVGQYVFENYLNYRHYQVLKSKAPPVSIKEEVSKETFDKSQEYSRAKLRFSVVSDTFNTLKHLALIRFDIFPKLWSFSGSLMSKCAFFLPKFMSGAITQSLFFVGIDMVIESLLSLPFSYYSNFVLEEKYGFNKLSIKVWLGDQIKMLLVSFALGELALAGLLKIFDYFGDSFITYAMLFMLAIQLIGMTIYPTLIAPLFNKFTPLEDGELKDAIEDLAKQQNFPVTKLYVVDGSTKSAHSNAYFVGLPWSKQIVLFDTLINQSTKEEIVAVLAHEIGHWKYNHLLQLEVFYHFHLFVVFFLFSAFIHNKSLYKSFGFRDVQPTFIGFLLANDLFQPLDAIVQFGMKMITRKNEYEADSHAKNCGYEGELAEALIKLNKENLGSMNADWLYSSYHHTHPLLPERLAALHYVSKHKISEPEKDIKTD
ncbi:uncharacterized protein PRCAT00002709001 [Priceomyces carsonii]|uniref:uncharacterized protein n=1 Tax=Priceomyces carsonii TaxID=28549 RepID=UPI002ED9B888|nr:unnamed protein product [Priceomyces carsonii]